MKRKITLLDKIFSFRESIIRQYIENELSDYIDQIDFKTDIMRRHWMFFLVKSFHIFLFMWIFSYLWILIIKYQNLIHNIFSQWNFSINVLIWLASFIVIFWFIIYIIRVKTVNKIWTFLWLIISLINIFITFPEKISLNYITEILFTSASILSFIFLIETILRCIKIIYNILVDYKNDFIVIYPEWLFISEKSWALYHSVQRILFDEIVDVSSREKWIFWTVLWFWKLKISIIWTWSDYEFRYCKNIFRVPTRLNKKRIQYSELKKMKDNKDPIIENKSEINTESKTIIKEAKPFKSRLRDDLIKVLNLKK